jgi:hypothetical protein
MLRRLFTFASALSLVVCVGTAALWIGSYKSPYSRPFQRNGIHYRFVSERGAAWTDNKPEIDGKFEPGYQEISRLSKKSRKASDEAKAASAAYIAARNHHSSHAEIQRTQEIDNEASRKYLEENEKYSVALRQWIASVKVMPPRSRPHQFRAPNKIVDN